MKTSYVPKSLNEFLGESKSITLKRKYGERPNIVAGTNAPLRNQVLSFVAENASVSKKELKKFIVGLREGGATVASANMFIKRNIKYFIKESRDGVTYFKLSELGRRLVNQISSTQMVNVSESKKDKKKFKKLNEKFDRDIENPEFPDENQEPEFSENPEENPEENSEEMPEFPEEGQETSDETSEPYKARLEEIVELAEDLYSELGEDELPDWIENKIIKVKQHLTDITEYLHDLEEEKEGQEEGPHRKMDIEEGGEGGVFKPEEESREYDFEDKGRPGIYDMDEEQISKHMEKIIENLKVKAVNEAEEQPDEKDELSDEDLNTVDAENPEENPEEVEKVEITEFIITVDNVDEAIKELADLGVTAERIPVEEPEAEVPAETPEAPAEGEEKAEETPKETGEQPDLSLDAQKESIQAFFKDTYLNEDENNPEAGTSDELGLGDQGEEAKELENPEGQENPETNEPTTEFEENKIKVKAEDWDTLKGWLEEKGVDVKEMFGGDIETEEVSPEEASKEEGPAEEIPDEEINFSGVSDDDKTKIKDQEEKE